MTRAALQDPSYQHYGLIPMELITCRDPLCERLAYACRPQDCKRPVPPCRSHITVEDVEHFMNAKHAAEAFAMLDADEDGQASLTDVRNAVTTIFK